MIPEIFRYFVYGELGSTLFLLLVFLIFLGVKLRLEKEKTRKLQREIDELKERLMSH